MHGAGGKQSRAASLSPAGFPRISVKNVDIPILALFVWE